jgi:Mor family transcriptional regulator
MGYSLNKKERDLEIIAAVKDGNTLKELSNAFGLSQCRISVILNEYGMSKIVENKKLRTKK